LWGQLDLDLPPTGAPGHCTSWRIDPVKLRAKIPDGAGRRASPPGSRVAQRALAREDNVQRRGLGRGKRDTGLSGCEALRHASRG
jgi:hypothetical protein